MKPMKILALLAVIAVSSSVDTSAGAAAQSATPSMYEVEIIVFRVTDVGASEDWSAVPSGRGFGSMANRGGATPTLVKVLTASDYRLSGIDGALKSSGAWHPLAHAAWIQTAANWGTHAGLSLSDLGISVPGLSGTVYLERAPIYVHLGFDVHYQAGPTYTINEMRSVKYNDKQYFDHPAFGIIAQVTPIRRSDASTAR